MGVKTDSRGAIVRRELEAGVAKVEVVFIMKSLTALNFHVRHYADSFAQEAQIVLCEACKSTSLK